MVVADHQLQILLEVLETHLLHHHPKAIMAELAGQIQVLSHQQVGAVPQKLAKLEPLEEEEEMALHQPFLVLP